MGGPPVAVDRDLLRILACPACKGPLREEAEALRCDACRLRYPVRDGIPVLLESEAEPAGPDGDARAE
jgi:uncharacterized protein YbaR (Trm112 family)